MKTRIQKMLVGAALVGAALVGAALVGAALVGAATLVQAQFNYTNNGNGTCTITGYAGPGGALSIPNSINGLTVVSIGDSAFYNNGSLTSVSVPASVTSIGGQAFFNCEDLTSITIPASVTSIGDNAFAYCYRLTSVTIGDGVTSIGDYAFEYCTSLTSVTIGNGVTSIEAGVFYYCIGLTSVTIGNSVTSIGEYAFYQCTSLTSVIIPDSVVSIGYFAFGRCYSLAAAFFMGNPPYGADVFDDGFAYDPVIVYYLPGATGWGPFFSGRPTELWNPQASALRVTGGHFGFNISGPSNTVIVVEACTNLAQPVWLPVSTNFLDGGGASSFSDSQSGNYPARFYRFRSP